MSENNTNKRRRIPESRRESILDAAEELFLKRGFADIAISEIATKADVTKSLIHHHFGSKEDLWMAVKARRFEGYIESQSRLMERSEPTEGLLRESFLDYFRYLQNNPELVRLFIWAQAEGDSHGVGHALMKPSIEVVQQAQSAGLIRADVEPFDVLRIGIGMITYWFEARNMMLEWECLTIETAPPDTDDKFINSFLKIYLDGLRPEHQGASA